MDGGNKTNLRYLGRFKFGPEGREEREAIRIRIDYMNFFDLTFFFLWGNASFRKMFTSSLFDRNFCVCKYTSEMIVSHDFLFFNNIDNIKWIQFHLEACAPIFDKTGTLQYSSIVPWWWWWWWAQVFFSSSSPSSRPHLIKFVFFFLLLLWLSSREGMKMATLPFSLVRPLRMLRPWPYIYIYECANIGANVLRVEGSQTNIASGPVGNGRAKAEKTQLRIFRNVAVDSHE